MAREILRTMDMVDSVEAAKIVKVRLKFRMAPWEHRRTMEITAEEHAKWLREAAKVQYDKEIEMPAWECAGWLSKLKESDPARLEEFHEELFEKYFRVVDELDAHPPVLLVFKEL